MRFSCATTSLSFACRHGWSLGRGYPKVRRRHTALCRCVRGLFSYIPPVAFSKYEDCAFSHPLSISSLPILLSSTSFFPILPPSFLFHPLFLPFPPPLLPSSPSSLLLPPPPSSLFSSPGPTAYVLTGVPSGVGYLLWNPNTGRYYRQYDPHCPLKSVGCIFNHDNVCVCRSTSHTHTRARTHTHHTLTRPIFPFCSQIWANIQPYDDPGRISLNIDSSKQWSPLFKDKAALASHQVQCAGHSV